MNNRLLIIQLMYIFLRLFKREITYFLQKCMHSIYRQYGLLTLRLINSLSCISQCPLEKKEIKDLLACIETYIYGNYYLIDGRWKCFLYLFLNILELIKKLHKVIFSRVDRIFQTEKMRSSNGSGFKC